MAKLSATVITEQQITLTPEQKLQLQRELKVFEGLQREFEDSEEARDAQLAHVAAIREKIGAKTIDLGNGYRTTGVDGGTNSTVNKKRLFALITPDQYESCKDTKPKKGHELITTPSDKPKKPRKGADVENNDRE